MSYDTVDKPQHYNSHPSGIQPIEIAEHMTLCLGTAFIYGWRYNQKGTPLEDLRKMRWFMVRQQDHDAGAAYHSAEHFALVTVDKRKVFDRPSPWCEPVRHALAALCNWHATNYAPERDRLLKRAIQCVDTAIQDECCYDGRALQP
jgi:hypothetical protein